MKKIEGYPVVINGKFYSSQEGGQAGEREEAAGGTKKLIGGLTKSIIKKKPQETGENTPALSYYFELVELISEYARVHRVGGIVH